MNSTPDNINDLTRKEVVSLVTDLPVGNAVTIEPPNVRARLLKVLYDVFGYDLSNDALLALTSEPSAELILATAGAGKTTAVQSKIVLEKLIRKINGKPLQGRRVLCIVYNKHNVNQMIRSQEKLARKAKRRGVKIDGEIAAHTMHSYCYKWFNHFNTLTQFIGGNMIEQFAIAKQFEALAGLLIQDKSVEITETLIDDLISLYNLVKETMTEYEDCDSLELFETISLPKDMVVQLFRAYDKGKLRKNQYDYTDMLHELYKLLRDREDVRNYIQNHYDYIVADEVQDMTKIMMEILRLSKRDDVPLLCIGDEDQNIYSFRGATIKTILSFEDMFDDAKVYSLSTNRRCGQNIIDVAKSVISHNTLRYEKPMRAIREGGEISLVPYCKHEDQIADLCNKLKVMSQDELDQTCVCYRNRRSSMLLSSKLEELGIPFHVLSGYPAYSAEVFQHILSIMRILLYPYDREEILNIYKVLPIITKGDVFNTLGYNPKTKQFTRDREKIHFSQYDYGKSSKNPKVVEALNFLTNISNNINTLPMDKYMGELIVLFYDSFWKSKMHYNKCQEEDMMFTDYAMRFFDSNLPYSKFYETFNVRMDRCRVNDQQKSGVCLSTFHSLKGLEFKNVFIIDLVDSVYPNFGKIDDSNYSDELKVELKESETRLFFVAVTRAKDNLVFYYNVDNPSEYIKWIQEPDEFAYSAIGKPPYLDSEAAVEREVASSPSAKPVAIADTFSDPIPVKKLDIFADLQNQDNLEPINYENSPKNFIFSDDNDDLLDDEPSAKPDSPEEVEIPPSAKPDVQSISSIFGGFGDDDLLDEEEDSISVESSAITHKDESKDFSTSFLDTVMDRFFS